ncbi:hypothetical protein RBSWK_04007 [Rhodopirellula baltica SWK14]|uniref:Uncharacterized protein n=1 Tax=Rhodopirellula baltica SWK14 TaxID=993516 RepID=L7CDK3_RHOBT|nr:hypothetical protein RBSWK_04007 [Rhodopirellula baltica SWK14]
MEDQLRRSGSSQPIRVMALLCLDAKKGTDAKKGRGAIELILRF